MYRALKKSAVASNYRSRYIIYRYFNGNITCTQYLVDIGAFFSVYLATSHDKNIIDTEQIQDHKVCVDFGAVEYMWCCVCVSIFQRGNSGDGCFSALILLYIIGGWFIWLF